MALKLSIIIPVYNEPENTPLILEKIDAKKFDFSYEILIVYDFEQDSTVPAVKKLLVKYRKARLVHNTIGRGVANAIRSGINASKGEHLLILSADDFGPVEGINDMIFLMDQGCDFVSATRYAYGGRRDMDSLRQRLLSRTANRLFNLLTGSVFSDLTTGFKMIRKEALKKLHIESQSRSWSIVFEMAIKAQAAGLKLGEVPIRSTDRKHGKSTFRFGSWVREYSRWFLWGLKHLHGRKVEKPIVKIPSHIKND